MDRQQDIRDLAAQLGALGTEAFSALLASRGLTDKSRIEDLFDLAEWLLDPAEVSSRLRRLGRPQLAAVLRLSSGTNAERDSSGTGAADSLPVEDDPSLIGLIVTGRDGLRLSAALEPELNSLDAASSIAAAAPDRCPLTDEEESVAVQRAVTTVGAMHEVLRAVGASPLRLTASGRVAASEVKRVAAAAAEEHDTVESLLHLAAIAGLTRQSTTRSVAPAGAAWLDSSLGTRWSVLADALARRGGGMFTELVSAGAGTPVREYGRWLTPLNGGNDPIPPDDLAAAEALGLAEDGRLTALGVALGTDPAVAVGAVLAAAPPTVEAVYLQQDLSVIAPGTLRADLDARLRQLSDVESRAEANSYRFTPESIERALLAGDRASDVLEFLERISLTGIPQSLRYLVEDQASRLDRIVVTPAPAGAGSVVTTDDERLAAQLAVDTELRLLELAHDGSRTVHSPYPAEFVHASLRDARHPARLAAAGSPEPPADASGTGRGDGPSPTAAPAPDRATVASQPFALLLSRLLAARPDTPGDFEQLWARRLLTTAVRERGTVRVRIRRSDGTEREAQLEPTGVSQERLRARDRENDTERTLPLSAIVEVTADV